MDGMGTICFDQLVQHFVGIAVADVVEGNSILSTSGETCEGVLVLEGRLCESCK